MKLEGPLRDPESLPVIRLPDEADRHPSVNSHLLAAPVRIVGIVGFWVLVIVVRALALDAEAEKTAREANQTIVGIWETRDHSVWFEFTAEGQFSVCWPPNPFMDREARDEPLYRGRYSILPEGEIEISDLWHPQTRTRLLVEEGCRFKAQLLKTGRSVRITGSAERRGTIVVPIFEGRRFGKMELPPKGEEELNLYRVR